MRIRIAVYITLALVLLTAVAASGIIYETTRYDGTVPPPDYRDEWLQLDDGTAAWLWGLMGYNLGDGAMDSDYLSAFANHLIVPGTYTEGVYCTKVDFGMYDPYGGSEFSNAELQYVITYHNDADFQPVMGEDLYRLIPPVTLADLDLPTGILVRAEIDIVRDPPEAPDFGPGEAFWTLFNPVGSGDPYLGSPVVYFATDDADTEPERSKWCDGATWTEFGWGHYWIRCYVRDYGEYITGTRESSIGRIKALYR